MSANDLPTLDGSANDGPAVELPVGAETAGDIAVAAEAVHSAEASGAVIVLAARAEEADAIARPTDGLVTVRAKPEKRKNAKERAKDKITNAKITKDGTTPMTAKAKSKVQDKAAKLAEKARKADTKAHKISAAKAAKAARAA